MPSQKFTQHVQILGDTWVLLILKELCNSNLRFNQIKDRLPEITARTLSTKLKCLVEKNVLTKTCPDNNRNYCEYSLTKKGEQYKKVVRAISNLT